MLTNHYLAFRKEHEKREASDLAVAKSLPSILTSGGILIAAAYLIKFGSSMKAVSEMGGLIGRGALISVLLVVFFLPPILVLLDKVIQHTTWNHSRKEVVK